MFISKRKFNKLLKEKFDNSLVELTMIDGTTKIVKGNEWLSMNSKLIKRFKIID